MIAGFEGIKEEEVGEEKARRYKVDGVVYDLLRGGSVRREVQREVQECKECKRAGAPFYHFR